MRRTYRVQVQEIWDEVAPDTWHDVGPDYAWRYQAMMFGKHWVGMPEILAVRVVRVMSEEPTVR